MFADGNFTMQMRYTVRGRIRSAMSIKNAIVTSTVRILEQKTVQKRLAHLNRATGITHFHTLMPNNVLKSSMMMWRSSMWRRVFLMPLAEYNGGLSASAGGDGISASNCKLSRRLWHTSFVFDMDNCINFSGWYSVLAASKENRINWINGSKENSL